jgi:hypothetical protein
MDWAAAHPLIGMAEAMTLTTLRSKNMPTPTVINKFRYSDVINRRYWDRYFFSNMSVNPVISKVGGGAAAGASGETDVMNDSKSIFEYFNIVGNTNLGPKLDGSFGLNLATDATSTHGVEYNTGVTPQNNFTFLIDTTGNKTPAFFLKCQLQLATANGATVELGFRKLQANNATFTSYTDYATIGLIAGEFEINTQIASGGAVITDTTQAAVNATMFEIAVFVDSMGNVTYQINGSAPTVTAAYQFANALTVMPFLRIVQNATTTATARCNYFECGFQS